MIRAPNDRILVRIVEVEKKSGNVLLISDKKEFQIGHVISVGYEITDIEEGNFVYSRKFAGLLVSYDNVDYVSLRDDEIIAVSKELK